MFQSQYIPTEPGQHQITLACKETGATLPATFFVQGAAREQIGKPARPEVLEEIARVTRGQSVDPGKVEEIVQKPANLPLPPPSIRRLQLWSHPLVAGLVVVLLGAFWVGRKVVGLI